MNLSFELKHVEDLHVEFRKKIKEQAVYTAEKLVFSGVDSRDVYNITAPFVDNGKKIIAGRVEERDSEHSTVIFLRKPIVHGIH